MGSIEFTKRPDGRGEDRGWRPASASADYGDDHVRIALIENEHRLRQAARGNTRHVPQRTACCAARRVIRVAPERLEGHGVRLEPLSSEHEAGLKEAAQDGKLWELFFTSVPEPDQVSSYISLALEKAKAGRDAALGGARPEGRRDRRQHALPRHRRGCRPRGDRLHLVRAALPEDARPTPPASCFFFPLPLKKSIAGSSVCGTDNFNFRSQARHRGAGRERRTG